MRHADDVLKLHLAVSLVMPAVLICVCLYILLLNPSNMSDFERIIFTSWLMAAISFMGIACLGGAYVNDEVGLCGVGECIWC